MLLFFFSKKHFDQFVRMFDKTNIISTFEKLTQTNFPQTSLCFHYAVVAHSQSQSQSQSQ